MDNKTLAIVIIVTAIIVLVGFSGSGMMGYGYSMMGNYWGFNSIGIFGFFICILFIILLVFATVWLIKQLRENK